MAVVVPWDMAAGEDGGMVSESEERDAQNIRIIHLRDRCMIVENGKRVPTIGEDKDPWKEMRMLRYENESLEAMIQPLQKSVDSYKDKAELIRPHVAAAMEALSNHNRVTCDQISDTGREKLAESLKEVTTRVDRLNELKRVLLVSKKNLMELPKKKVKCDLTTLGPDDGGSSSKDQGGSLHGCGS